MTDKTSVGKSSIGTRRKKRETKTYAPDERAFDKGDDLHDAQGFRKRTFTGPERLTYEVKSIAKKVLTTRGFAGLDIIECWDDIIGEDMAKGIRPEKLTFEKDSRTHGTLHVKSAGGAFAVLFEHQKNQIIERINTFFGYPAVSKIHISQGKLLFPRAEPIRPIRKPTKEEIRRLEAKVSHIEDEALRNTTYHIGLSLLQKEKS